MFSSLDGVTWSGPALIGVGMADLDAAVLTADGAAVDLLSSDTGTNRFQRAPLGGPPATFALNLATNPDGTETDYDYPGDMIRLRSGRTMALLGSPADGFVYRVLAGADPFADASWQPWPAARVTKEWEEPRATGGPRGAFVMYGVHILDQVWTARRRRSCASSTAGAGAARAGCSTRSPRTRATRRSPRTARAACTRRSSATRTAGAGSCIAYARSSRKRWFTRAVSVHQTLKDAEKPGRVRLAVDDTGRGVVTWSTTVHARRGARAVVEAGPPRHPPAQARQPRLPAVPALTGRRRGSAATAAAAAR